MINAGFNPADYRLHRKDRYHPLRDLKHVMAGEKTSDDLQSPDAIRTGRGEKTRCRCQRKREDVSRDWQQRADILQFGGMTRCGLLPAKAGCSTRRWRKQSKTAAGLISTLKDNVQILLGDVFTGTSEAMKEQAIACGPWGISISSPNAFRSGGTPALMSAPWVMYLGRRCRQSVSAFAPSLVKTSVGLIKSLLNGFKNNAKVIAKGLAETIKAAVVRG